MTKIYDVTFAGEGQEAETVTVVAANQAEARDVAEYELYRAHPEILSLRDSGLTIRGVVTVPAYSEKALAFLEARDVADYYDMISDLRYGA